MATHVQIRRATPRDSDALGGVFHAAVHDGAGQYSPGQRAAWSPAPPSGDSWHAHLGAQSVWVAEMDGRPVGFMTLTPEGYVDLAYILAEAQGQGLFRRLYAGLEEEALASGLVRIWTDASLHAKAPFEAVGFAVCYAETVSRSGETLKRFRMEKVLNA